MSSDPAAEVPPSRRQIVQLLASVLGTGLVGKAHAQPALQVDVPQPTAAGAQPSPLWNAPGPLVTLPQKVPLIQLTDRPVQLETPRAYFLAPRTPNAAFFVRWHLPLHPRSVDLAEFRLRVEGHVKQPLSLRFAELLRDFRPQTVVAVNQCAGNSRSRFTPRVPGSQWGNGAMGCAEWTGVRLRDLLGRAGLQPGAVAVQLAALDRGMGPQGYGSSVYLKSLAIDGDMLDEAIVAYAMNGEPLPLLNGFPLRVVVPGYFATYWVKALTALRVLAAPDENFWMKTAYRIPQTPDGSTTPEAIRGGSVKLAPIGRMPVRSFIVTPMGDGAGKLIRGLPVTVRGLAFSGHDRITRVEVSIDDGRTWTIATLGEDLGRYAFRPFSFRFTPSQPGRLLLAVRASDGRGGKQSDVPIWNPGGYLWNRPERQEVSIGDA
jgi:DMSO/TMAO reductase YedYZ molybdopterin-dependent catalytic subunit